MKGKKGKKDLQQQARIGGGCTADEGLLALTVCTKTKVERGKQLFPRRRIVPPLATLALSHLARIPMPLRSFVLQLPSPSRCVWCQLDKFLSFFLPSSRTSAGQCQLRYRCRRHQPPSLPPQHCRYLTNPVAATTPTMPPLAPTLTCVAGHTQATSPPSLSLCVFFSSFYFILVISLFISN